MNRILLLIAAVSFVLYGCASTGSGSTVPGMPGKLAGTWENKDYLSYKLIIDGDSFSLEVFDREGKQARKFTGIIKKADTTKNFVLVRLTGLVQGGEDIFPTINGVRYKELYYKDLTDTSVKLFIINGMSAEKFLNSHDEDAKLDRKYSLYKKI